MNERTAQSYENIVQKLIFVKNERMKL